MIKRGPAPPQPAPFAVFKKRQTNGGGSVQQPQAAGNVLDGQQKVDKNTPAQTPAQTPDPLTSLKQSNTQDNSNPQKVSGGDPIIATSGSPQTNYDITEMVHSSYDNNPFIQYVQGSLKFQRGDFQPLNASVNGSTDAEPDLIGIKIQDSRVFQEMEGLGAGLSDSSAMVLLAVKKNKPDVYWDILHLLFCTSEKWLARGSVGMNIVRIPIGGSDFSLVR